MTDPEQTAFNLQRWEGILADPSLALREERIETDRHGNLIISPPPDSSHSNRQTKILLKIHALISHGKPQCIAPISTSDGIRAADVAWTSYERLPKIYDPRAYLAAPDICVEVVSPTNSPREMAEKKALYFDAGAAEVWLCQLDGTLEFFATNAPGAKPTRSSICPDFPTHIESP